MLAPVGEIWEQIRQTHPEIELFWHDGEHASPYGSYLEAGDPLRRADRCDVTALPDIGADFSRGAEISFH